MIFNKNFISISLIFLIFLKNSAEEGNVDLIRKYIRPKDIYSLDISKYVDFHINSLDFQCNNPDVQLPGFPKQNEATFLPEQLFNPIEVKYLNNYLFVLNNDQKTFFKIRLNPSVIVDFAITRKLKENEKLKCNDMLVEDNYLFVLCFEENSEEKTQKYLIFAVDYFLDKILSIKTFTSEKMKNPKIKNINKIQNKFWENKSSKINQIGIVIFDKQYKHTEEFKKEQNIYYIGFQLNQEEKENLENKNQLENLEKNKIDVQHLELHENPIDYLKLDFQTIFKNEQNKILNIIFDQESNFLLIVHQTQKDIGKTVSKCTFSKNDSFTLNKCENFIKEQISHFFYKNKRYAVVSLQKGLKMCFYQEDKEPDCNNGVMQTSWKINSLMLEGDRFMLAFEDGQTKESYFFMYNFLTKDFNWFTSKIKEYEHLKLFKEEKTNDTFYLINFLKKGFKQYNLTFNPHLIVKAENIKSNEPISLFLGKTKLLQLELIPWDGKTLVNENEKNPPRVISLQSAIKQIKIGFRASGISFNPQNDQFIDYFRPISYNFNFEDNDIPMRIFNYNKITYVFTEKGIYLMKCYKTIFSQIVDCKEINNIQNQIPLNKELLKNMEVVGQYIYFNGKKSKSEITVFDLQTNKIKQFIFQSEMENLKECKLTLQGLFCVQKGEKTDLMRIFNLAQKELVLQEDFESQSEFQNIVEQILLNNSEKDPITRVDIVNFELNNGDQKTFVIQFSLVKDTVYRTILTQIEITWQQNKRKFTLKKQISDYELQFDITQETKLFVNDSQKIYLSMEPKFNLFVLNGSSYSEMQPLDASFIKDSYIYKEKNLFSLIFMDRSDTKWHFAIYDLTSEATHQLIVNQPILNFNENLCIRFTPINDIRTSVFLYDFQTGKTVETYEYFEKGPVLYTKNIQEQLMINESFYEIKSFVDESVHKIDFQWFNWVDENEKNIISLQNGRSIIRDQLQFYGNLRDISLVLNPNIEQKNWPLKIEKPLRYESTIMLRRKMQNLQNFKQNELGNLFQFTEENQDKVNYIRFDLENRSSLEYLWNKCRGFDVHSDFLICLGEKQNEIYIQLVKEEIKYEQKIPFNGGALKLIKRIQNQFSYLIIDDNRNKLAVFQFDLAQKNQYKLDIINERTLLVDSLFVTNIFSFLEENDTKSDLFIFIFDDIRNKIYLQHFDFLAFKPVLTIKKFISLNEYDQITKNFNCLRQGQFKYQCTFVGSVSLFTLNIQFNEKENNWQIQQESDKYNILHEQQFNDFFEPMIDQSGSFLYLTNLDKNVESSIALYQKEKDKNYLYYFTKIEEFSRIVFFKEINKKLFIGGLNQNSDFVGLIYKVSDYELVQIKNEIVEAPQFKGEFFENSELKVDFRLVEEARKQIEEKKTWLTVLIITLILAVFLMLIYILILTREKKKLNERLTVVSEDNSNKMALHEN